MKHVSTKEKEVLDAMNSGKYKVANLEIIEKAQNFEMTEKLYDHLEYTKELFETYLTDISELKDDFPGLEQYLEVIKTADIIDNHKLEKENSFLLGMFYHTDKEKAIDRLIKYTNDNKILDSNDLFFIHNLLLYGTSSDEKDLVRTTNEKFVGKIENGKRIIDYFPLHYKDVPMAADKIAQLYNMDLENDSFNNMFIKPFMIHGLFAALQMFNDGNTRMGRLIQHVLMWKLVNEQTNFSFDKPPIYATRSYYPFRGEYRSKIASLVIDNNNEAWEKWFDFNLKRIEDQIFMGNENLVELKRRVKSR